MGSVTVDGLVKNSARWKAHRQKVIEETKKVKPAVTSSSAECLTLDPSKIQSLIDDMDEC